MIEILSPLSGWAAPLDELPDPVFAERMLGDGLAIDPVEGELRSPVTGTVESIHAALHAYTIAADSGPVLLLHVGLETVALGGRGFSPLVKAGDRVEAGALLCRFDLDFLAQHARSLATPVVVTNSGRFRISRRAEGAVRAGIQLMTLEAVTVEDGGAADSSGPSASRDLLLPLAHGLHARPAARIAAEAGRFDADLTLTAGERTASARSPVAMLALGLPHGARFALSARGPQAEAAIEAVSALIESGMGELLPVNEVGQPAVEAPAVLPDVVHGVRASPGRGSGPAFRFRRPEIMVREQAGSAAEERALLIAARGKARDALANRARAGAQAAIAAAHMAFLDDPALIEAAEREIASGASAGVAWRRATTAFAALLAGADRRFAERADDLRDIERQILSALAGDAADASPPPSGAIVIGADLGPSDMMALASAGLAGMVLADGGPTSHVAIIAQGLGLPMLAAAGAAVELVPDGRMLLLDADAGTLETAPTEARLAAVEAQARIRAEARAEAARHAHEPAILRDGQRIEVFANLGSADDAATAFHNGAEGCGLLRSEFLFLDRAQPPSAEEQRLRMQEIADAMGGKPLVIRTLDIGADKPAPWLSIATEENPALGLRGIRLQLARPDLLETQFRAILAVDAPVSIMLPMVAHVDELRTARAALGRVADMMGREAPPLGIMVETPSAALLADALAREAAFFSIGSNDLTQYALAADRTNPAVALSLDGLHPAVLRLIAMTTEGAKRHGRWVGLCGSLAAEPAAVPVLIGLGIEELSVPPAAVATTKAQVRTLSMQHCRELARKALEAPDPATVRTLVMGGMEAAA